MHPITLAAIGAALLLPAAVAAQPLTHHARIDTSRGSVDARYRGDVAITYRQVGAVGAPGRPSTLRCRWDADLRVEREARTTGGGTLTRSLGRDAVLSGHRPGWCGSGRAAVEAEVAARRDALDRHLRAVAAEDHQRLRAELERAGASATG